jgi:hypothetical protein
VIPRCAIVGCVRLPQVVIQPAWYIHRKPSAYTRACPRSAQLRTTRPALLTTYEPVCKTSTTCRAPGTRIRSWLSPKTFTTSKLNRPVRWTRMAKCSIFCRSTTRVHVIALCQQPFWPPISPQSQTWVVSPRSHGLRSKRGWPLHLLLGLLGGVANICRSCPLKRNPSSHPLGGFSL